MKLKIRYFLEVVIFHLHTFFSRVRFFLSKDNSLNEIYSSNKSKKCIVLGNGPSIKNDIEVIKRQIGNSDYLAVNHFCESSDFEILKPNKYVLLDEYFWHPDASLDLIEKRDKMFSALNKASWEIELFLPYYSDKSFIKNKIDNNFITINFYKVVPVQGVPINDDKIISLFDSGTYGPAACNVLIYGVYVAIMSGYKDIEIFGADFSFHNDVFVDQKDNSLKIKYKHFYGESEYVPFMKNPTKKEAFRMSEFMHITYETCLAHDRLSKLAEKRGIKIRNRSTYSMIDSYPR
ncbi:conserved hypothetical protein [Vibrio owensii]|nr:conserved hypothetical protein [Vibrio owensii]